jgi:CRISPR-associated protein Csb1
MTTDQPVTLEQFDLFLNTDEVAALANYQLLEPIEEGSGGVIFPPTFAPESKTEKGDYNIDATGGSYHASIVYDPAKEATVRTDVQHDSGRNVCLIDSVGAQANRIEPIFKPEKCDGRYADLVPQVRIKVRCTKPGREREWYVNLLDAGHRAGDAIVRFTPFGEQVFDAFKAYGESGDAEKLARIAPTSLVFGVWDSRGTQEKVARIFRSVIRATDVVRLNRSAQYVRTVKYVENGLVPEELDNGDSDKNPLSREGFNDNPAGRTHGGVRVMGEIRRDVTINLSAIRRLRVPTPGDPAKNDTAKTLALRRYILGLSLVAATARTEDKYNLREGCQLRQKRGFTPIWREVKFEGDDAERHDLSPDRCERYARLAAENFAVAKDPIETEFDPKTTELWLRLDEKQQKKLRVEKPMTKQDFASAAKDKKLSGTFVGILPDGTGFKMSTGTKKNKQEIDVTVNEKTAFQGKDGGKIEFSAFTALAVNSKLEVKPATGVAEAVTLK